MKLYLLITLFFGLTVGLFILFMIRKNMLQVKIAFYWIFVAFGIIIFGVFPRLSDVIAMHLGINYSPILVIIVGMLFLFVKALDSDIKLTKKEEQIREISQRLALLESEVWKNIESNN